MSSSSSLMTSSGLSAVTSSSLSLSDVFTPPVYSDETKSKWSSLFSSDKKSKGTIVLLITSSHPPIFPDGKRTGVHWKELLLPFESFLSAGYDCVMCSESGEFHVDEKSVTDLADSHDKKTWNDKSHPIHRIIQRCYKSIDLLPFIEGFMGLYSAGGHGCMYDYPSVQTAKGGRELVSLLFERGGIVGLVCHAPAILQGLKLSDGTSLVKGKQVTGFSTSLENKMIPGILDQWQEKGIVTVEEGIRREGGIYKEATNPMGEYVLVDGRLVTGENPASAKKVASEMISKLDSLLNIGVGGGQIDYQKITGGGTGMSESNTRTENVSSSLLGDKNRLSNLLPERVKESFNSY